MGKGMDGSTGFKVPDANECSMLLSTVEKFNNNVFKVGSLSQSNQMLGLAITKVGDFPSNLSGCI